MSDPIASSSASSSTSGAIVVQIAPSKGGRTPGKAHKSAKTAVRRSYLSPALKTPFAKRMEAEQRRQAVRGVEKDLKEEKASEKERKVNIIKERREKAAEKKRMEEAAAKMSAKRLQRMRKRQGRSKKING